MLEGIKKQLHQNRSNFFILLKNLKLSFYLLAANTPKWGQAPGKRLMIWIKITEPYSLNKPVGESC